MRSTVSAVTRTPLPVTESAAVRRRVTLALLPLSTTELHVPVIVSVAALPLTVIVRSERPQTSDLVTFASLMTMEPRPAAGVAVTSALAGAADSKAADAVPAAVIRARVRVMVQRYPTIAIGSPGPVAALPSRRGCVLDDAPAAHSRARVPGHDRTTLVARSWRRLEAMTNELGTFLQSRRAKMSPAQAGLSPGPSRRRVPGLRREEVALLAGVSVDYYVHLEQGRSANVSDAVLDAVARVLALTATEREHVGNLARPRSLGRRAGRPPVSSMAGELLQLMDHVPALVLGLGMELLAANAAALAVFGPGMTDPGSNVARTFFLDSASRETCLNWESVGSDIVAQLRLDAGRHPDDARLAALVAELSNESSDFRSMWAVGDVRTKTDGLTRWSGSWSCATRSCTSPRTWTRYWRSTAIRAAVSRRSGCDCC